MPRVFENAKYESDNYETDSDTACNHTYLLSNFMEFKKLGEGGFSTVFEATNKLDEQKYAIKCIKYSEEERNIVLREVKALAQLTHDHIVRYYHAWVEECTLNLEDIVQANNTRDDSSNSIEFRNSSSGRGMKQRSDDAKDVSSSKSKRSSTSLSELKKRTLYIKMELCEGQSLLKWLEKTKIRRRDKVNKMVIQILDAVAYIHSKNLMHRDLKPANIFLTHDDTIKVGDFNLVKTVLTVNENDEDCDLHTSDVGTTCYQSPELVTKFYTETVDIYAIGVIWVELLIYFSTEHERKKVLQQLGHGMFPINFQIEFPMEHELLQDMLALDAENRPDAEKAFEWLSIKHEDFADAAGYFVSLLPHTMNGIPQI